jgi:hypothetical protein
MTLGAIQVGDFVLAYRKGRRFYAIVTGKGQRELQVDPIDRRVSYHHIKARGVVEVWHKRRARNGRASPGERAAA